MSAKQLFDFQFWSDLLRTERGAVVISIQSIPNTDAPRGSSTLRARSDVVFEVNKEDCKGLVFKCLKRRGGPILEPFTVLP